MSYFDRQKSETIQKMIVKHTMVSTSRAWIVARAEIKASELKICINYYQILLLRHAKFAMTYLTA